jgi:arsenate reductase
MADKKSNVLFLSHNNAARGLFAEALINRLGRTKFHGYSAGSHPKAEVDPLTIYELQRNNYDPAGLHSKDWSQFFAPDAPEMDFIFTLSDTVAAEAHPPWPGEPMIAHWRVADPTEANGKEITRKAAFLRAFSELENRISIFVNLPIESLDRLKLQRRLDEIGRSKHGESQEPAA